MLETCVKQAKPEAQVLAFDDQDELLEEAEKNGCDIAFLDIHMRGMNGVEVAKRLKNANPKMNIIFVTGFPTCAFRSFQNRMHFCAFSASETLTCLLLTAPMSALSAANQRKSSPILSTGTGAPAPQGSCSPSTSMFLTVITTVFRSLTLALSMLTRRNT